MLRSPLVRIGTTRCSTTTMHSNQARAAYYGHPTLHVSGRAQQQHHHHCMHSMHSNQARAATHGHPPLHVSGEDIAAPPPPLHAFNAFKPSQSCYTWAPHPPCIRRGHSSTTTIACIQCIQTKPEPLHMGTLTHHVSRWTQAHKSSTRVHHTFLSSAS